jgi:hypothetical protein
MGRARESGTRQLRDTGDATVRRTGTDAIGEGATLRSRGHATWVKFARAGRSGAVAGEGEARRSWAEAAADEGARRSD